MMHPRQEVMQCTRIVKDIQENIMDEKMAHNKLQQMAK